MKAVAYREAGTPEVLVDVEINAPILGAHDLLVEIKAVSVNPVDTQVRNGMSPDGGNAKILGYDASGIVKAVGANVTLFKAGDKVYYSGAFDRPGTNAQFHIVDERLVGRKPNSLSFAEAAALPLTALTAWEILFDRLRVTTESQRDQRNLLVINGAGGVGSILVQLARRLTGLNVIATASRKDTVEWVKRMGAHQVINHHQPLDESIRSLGIDQVELVAGLTGTSAQMAAIASIIAPQGHLCAIDDGALDIAPLKLKSVTVSWEMVFTRQLFETADVAQQHWILNRVADLVDSGAIVTTHSETLGHINASNLRTAHQRIEQGSMIGKLVLEGFD